MDDPIGDDQKSPIRGLVHRYPDRVLIKLVAVCAVYCRFCFRRERIGPGSASLSAAELGAALEYVRARPAIWEVILTGGDPLTLSTRRLAETTRTIAAIDHVKTLRWHTRVPVAAPERVTRSLARAIRLDGKTVVVAVHANHPRELTSEARAACRRLAAEGIMLVSQSVLLKGVNDDPETLEALMRAFVEARIKPYYLHHGDLAPGTGHWRVPVKRGQELMGCCDDASQGSRCRHTCSTSPAEWAKSRSGHSRFGQTGREAMSSSIRRGPSTSISIVSRIAERDCPWSGVRASHPSDGAADCGRNRQHRSLESCSGELMFEP